MESENQIRQDSRFGGGSSTVCSISRILLLRTHLRAYDLSVEYGTKFRKASNWIACGLLFRIGLYSKRRYSSIVYGCCECMFHALIGGILGEIISILHVTSKAPFVVLSMYKIHTGLLLNFYVHGSTYK